jgi:hypothetical protein
MPASGQAVEEGSEQSEPPPPPLRRLAWAGQDAAQAVSTAAVTAFAATKDGIESLQSGTRKAVVRMDNWAANGAVSSRLWAGDGAGPAGLLLADRLTLLVLLPAGGPHIPFQGAGCKAHDRAAGGPDHLPHGARAGHGRRQQRWEVWGARQQHLAAQQPEEIVAERQAIGAGLHCAS